MLPIASGPMPSTPFGVSSAPLAVISRPSTPVGGTALTSATTASRGAAASCAPDWMATPARPAHSATSVSARIAAFFASSLPSTARSPASNRTLISAAASPTRLMPS